MDEASEQMRSEFQKQIDALWAAVRKLEQNAAERAMAPAIIPKIEIVAPKDAGQPAGQPIAAQGSTPILREVEAAIKATLSAALGHEVRIRSVKLLDKEKPDTPSNWATQGRVAVQSSHNLRTTRD